MNEDCVALSALTESGIEDSVVIDYPEINEERHRYFTMRKRMQEAGQTVFNDVFRDKEQQFVHDHLHTVSRRVVEWIQRFDSPVIVFEDLEYIRDDIEYGARMNCRLHSLPFAKLRDFISYKAAWRGIPSDDVDPEYTSQQCPICGHTERANRHKKRFKCCECEHQDHADRGMYQCRTGVAAKARGQKCACSQHTPAGAEMGVATPGIGACGRPDRDPPHR